MKYPKGLFYFCRESYEESLYDIKNRTNVFLNHLLDDFFIHVDKLTFLTSQESFEEVNSHPDFPKDKYSYFISETFSRVIGTYVSLIPFSFYLIERHALYNYKRDVDLAELFAILNAYTTGKKDFEDTLYILLEFFWER